MAQLAEEHEQIVNALEAVLTRADQADLERASTSARELAGLLAPHTRFEGKGLCAELANDDVLGPHVRQL